MASATMPLVGAIVVALLTFAAMIRTSRTLFHSMELHSAPADAEIISMNDFCRTLPLLATMLLIPPSSYRYFERIRGLLRGAVGLFGLLQQASCTDRSTPSVRAFLSWLLSESGEGEGRAERCGGWRRAWK